MDLSETEHSSLLLCELWYFDIFSIQKNFMHH
jgi:hypothetical protein